MRIRRSVLAILLAIVSLKRGKRVINAGAVAKRRPIVEQESQVGAW